MILIYASSIRTEKNPLSKESVKAVLVDIENKSLYNMYYILVVTYNV